MAGSYSHIIDDEGKFRNDDFRDMIDNIGDAKEMAEELLLMIYCLSEGDVKKMKDALEYARRQNSGWKDRFVFYKS